MDNDNEGTPSFQKDEQFDPELSDEYDEEEQQEFEDLEQKREAAVLSNDEDLPQKRLNLNIAESEDKINTKAPKYVTHQQKKYATHHVPQDSNNKSPTPLTPQLTEIEDDLMYRREKFLNKSCIKKCCRGFRVQIAAILSVFDFWGNILCILLFILRAYDGKHFDFYIWATVIAMFLIATSVLSHRMAPAGKTKAFYFCQIGICFECQNSLHSGNYGHATYTFKLLNFLESMSRALPLAILKLFILIWYQRKYPYWTGGNWLLIVSITFSILSYSFWFTSHIKDTLRDKFNDVFESVVPKANRYDGDYNQDPSQSVRKFKMGWGNKIIFCIYIGLDLLTRCGITLVLLRYSPPLLFGVKAFNYIILPFYLMIEEGCTYFGLLYYLSDLYRNDIKVLYTKFQMALMMAASVITIAPFYNDCTKMDINYKKKLFVLFLNMLLRLIVMSAFVFILVYFTDFTFSVAQSFVFILFAVVQLILNIYSTNIIYKCERLTWLAREKTMSKSVVRQ